MSKGKANIKGGGLFKQLMRHFLQKKKLKIR